MEEIKSVKNPTVRWMRTLRERKGREESGAFLVEGRKMIEEARNAGLRALCLLAVEELREFAAGFDRAALVPDFVLEAVCDTKTPQGACAAFEMPKTIPLEAAPERLVALDGVQDPGNVGTIWRTADAAGFQGILLGAGCADAMSNKVQRAAMGSGFRLPALQAANLAEALGELRRKGWKVFASALDGEDFYRRPEMGEKCILVIGSEARGISPSVREQADCLVKLPMRGGAESLNAAVAAGIMMYEMMREKEN